MNKLDTAKRTQVVAALVEGCSIRSIVRMTGVSKNTIAKLLIDLGVACSRYMDAHLVNLKCERVQVDEIWSFIGCKQKQVTEKKLDNGVSAAMCGRGSQSTPIPSLFRALSSASATRTRLVSSWRTWRSVSRTASS
jgi:hypothetical protein